MNLSLNWLKNFVDVGEVSAREFAEKMTMSGSKVEGWINPADEIKRVVVGRILSVEKHPDADKLLVCKVDVGSEQVQIVTGATNIAKEDLIPIILDGGTLPGGVKIKRGKLRGVESQGMMCSLPELNLTAGDFPYAIEDGIFVLQEPCSPGDDIVDVLNLDDTIVEFEITPNRPDCLSVIGLAREVAATFNKPLKITPPAVTEYEGDITEVLSVSVTAPDLCKRYMARVIKDVKIAPSPRWLRERLRAHGLRPINNIVDITNYVMLEYGQPMHAFDYKFVEGKNIVVRTAEKGEKITTLDGNERALTEDMLVIANDKRPMAIGGVMGGENSGVTEETTTVVFESANFYGASIRNTSKALALRTDSSSKFEKGLDPQNCAKALNRACELVEMLSCGKVISGGIDVNNAPHTPKKVEFLPDWINAFIGINMSADDMKKILTDLDFEVNGSAVTVPSYRADVGDKADIAEEVARFYGYDKIKTTELRGAAAAGFTPRQKAEITVKNTLLACSYSEICTFSFISPKSYDKMLIPKDSPLRDCVEILNPLGEDTSVMRSSALPSFMEVLGRNFSNRNLSVRLFEVATEYKKQKDEQLPKEPKKIIFGGYGEGYDYYDLKGTAEEVFAALNIRDFDITPESSLPYFHPGRCAKLSVDGKTLGFIGEVHPVVAKSYDLDCKAYVGELDFSALLHVKPTEETYHKMPRFPSANRDLALICDIDLPVLSIEKTIKKAAEKLVEDVTLFDVYTGEQVERGKKSVAYSLTLRAPDRTLTDEETDGAVKKILKALDEIGVKLRA